MGCMVLVTRALGEVARTKRWQWGRRVKKYIGWTGFGWKRAIRDVHLAIQEFGSMYVDEGHREYDPKMWRQTNLAAHVRCMHAWTSGYACVRSWATSHQHFHREHPRESWRVTPYNKTAFVCPANIHKLLFCAVLLSHNTSAHCMSKLDTLNPCQTQNINRLNCI